MTRLAQLVLLLPLLAGCAGGQALDMAATQQVAGVRLLSSDAASPTTAVAVPTPRPALATQIRPAPTATPRQPTATPRAPTATPPAPSPTAKPKRSPSSRSAGAAARGPVLDPELVKLVLATSGLPIKTVEILSPASDPERLLGQANGYAAKVAWRDTRVGSAQGFAELFAGELSFRTRLQALQATGKPPAAAPPRAGAAKPGARPASGSAVFPLPAHKAILLLPKGLTAEQAADYQRAFARFAR